MKKINIPRIIWISSIFIILTLILFLVIKYKINYEYLNKNNLYFYECDSGLCISEVKDNKKLIYSKYECGYNTCPKYLKNIKEDYVLLEKDNVKTLYNYKKDKIISDQYEDYEFINSNYLIVMNKNKKGIIDINNNVITIPKYDEIGIKKEDYLSGYNLNNIIIKNNNLYGIISYKEGKIIEEIKYKEEEINTLIEILKNEQ